ncbi:imidazole glycerol phosphate synthase subunit HisH [Sphingopyxis solisilvae]|uniref:imidazole glycerol phosphate synthase subunit HisH n=1 Tax=Sphingopyxis solisilvae TaxID=1886788 RepID=UPI0018929C8B|nr:imidazole glycerol phosphate synthase subunit HisH [Sphingopyxis solisilvae]
MTVVGIIDYRAGNIRSIRNAFEHIGCETSLVTDAAQLDGVSHVVLPGVGAFAFCMQRLSESGMLPALEQWALVKHRPLLGICVGMQLMARCGLELGGHEGLNWMGGKVLPLIANGARVRVPHVGWNDVMFDEPFGTFAAGDKADFYFDHSFAFFDPEFGETIGRCTHGQDFAAVVRRGNVVAAQFHPEKSQDAGIRFLQGFLAL